MSFPADHGASYSVRRRTGKAGNATPTELTMYSTPVMSAKMPRMVAEMSASPSNVSDHKTSVIPSSNDGM